MTKDIFPRYSCLSRAVCHSDRGVTHTTLQLRMSKPYISAPFFFFHFWLFNPQYKPANELILSLPSILLESIRHILCQRLRDT